MSIYTVKEYAQKFYPAKSEKTARRRINEGLIPSNHNVTVHKSGRITIEVIDDIRLKKQPFTQIIK